jgi:hypothetical protein
MNLAYERLLVLFSQYTPTQLVTHVKLNPYGIKFYKYILKRLCDPFLEISGIINPSKLYIHTRTPDTQNSILNWILMEFHKFDKSILNYFLKVYTETSIPDTCNSIVEELKNKYKSTFKRQTVEPSSDFTQNDKKRRFDQIIDLTDHDEENTKKIAALTVDAVGKLQHLRKLWMETILEVPEETGILKNHPMSKLIFKEANLYQIPDENIPKLVNFLISPETGYDRCCHFVKYVLYKKVKVLKKGATRPIHASLSIIAKTHPNVLIDSLFIPLCPKGKNLFGSFQCEIFNKLFEKDPDPNIISNILKSMYNNKDLELNEFLITFIKNLLGKKIQYNEMDIKCILKMLDDQAVSFKSSVKFGNLIFTMISSPKFTFLKGSGLFLSICDKLDTEVKKSCLPFLK